MGLRALFQKSESSDRGWYSPIPRIAVFQRLRAIFGGSVVQFCSNLKMGLSCFESSTRMRMINHVSPSALWIRGIVDRGWYCLCDSMIARHGSRSVNVDSHSSDQFHSGHIGSRLLRMGSIYSECCTSVSPPQSVRCL